MTAYALKKLAKRYMNVWTADSQGLLDIYADESLTVEYTHFGRIKGIPSYKSLLKETYTFIPDVAINIGEIIPHKTENSVTLFWNYFGTHKEGKLFGLEPTGKQVRVNAMTLLEMENKKVIREKGIFDNMGLFMQLQQ